MDKDFLIIGAGVVGLGCAVALLEHGARVTVMDRGLCGGESSWAGGGILSPLCPWDYPREVNRLATRGAELFPAWAGALRELTGIDPEYVKCGMRILPPFNRQAALRWAESNKLLVEEDGGALILPSVAQVRNPRLIQALRRRVEMLGGRIVERCAVRKIAAENGCVKRVQSDCGDFEADEFIVAAGAWSALILGEHALHLDIRPVRGQMLLFKLDRPPIHQIFLQHDLYLIPRADGHLLVGSTLEEVGFDKSVTLAAREDLIRRAVSVLPQLSKAPLVRHWAGLRPASPHNIPVIGRHPYLNNLYINSGHFRYGVTMAPASVEILINDLKGSQQELDVSPYRAGWGGQ